MSESLRRLTSVETMPPAFGARALKRVRVELLDGDYISVDINKKARGDDLLDMVCLELELVDQDFFGLLYERHHDPRAWLDLHRRLSKAFRNRPWVVKLAVKYYPPEPSDLLDHNTQRQISLAVRQELREGRLRCSTMTHALLASYVMQAELGDRRGQTPLASVQAVPLHYITDEMEARADELYAKHKGQSASQAEHLYLETAKRLPMYGAELHCVRDSHHRDLVVAVGAQGVCIYSDGVQLNRLPWARISKISYHHSEFRLRLRPGESEHFISHVAFKLPDSRSSKKLWRCCVDNHIFFRRWEPVRVEGLPGLGRLGVRRVSCRRTLRQIRAGAPVA